MNKTHARFAETSFAKIASMVLSVFVTVLPLCSCSAQGSVSAGASSDPQPTEASSETPSETRRLIIDTDTGADDTSAIILAATCPNVQIEGLTVLTGNVDLEQSAANALMALQVANCKAPVYKGASTTYDGENKVAFSVFGADGMGEQDLIHPDGQAEEGDAIDFILDTVKAHPDEVEILMLGPATNIARAIERDPETMSHVAKIWSMGSAGLGPGNATPVAEFNVYADAQAYKVLLDSGVPVTIIGLDMCGGEAGWTSAQFEELAKTNDAGAFVRKSFSKLRDFYASNGSADSVMNCDALATMCALYPDFVNKTIACHGSCIVDNDEAFAQVIFYQKGFTYDMATNDFSYNVDLVTDCDKQDYFSNYQKAISTVL